MNKLIVAFFTLVVGLAAARAEDAKDDVMNKLINAPSVKSWVATGVSPSPEVIADPAVQAGQAVRLVVPAAGTNPWSVSADVSIFKPVSAGDVILVALWARAEVPAEGRTTGIISGIRLQEVKAPYAALVQDQADVTAKWTMYYASGVADKDYRPGTIKLTLHLGAAKQTIDLGPVFVLDFGPDYDRTKLPHNKRTVVQSAVPAPVVRAAAPAVPAPTTSAAAEQRFAAELTKIRATLPVMGTLINDPSVTSVGTYGPDQHKEIVPAPDVAGGQAVRVHVDMAQATSYASGTSSPLTGAIRKGDTVFVAFYVRAVEADGATGVISSIRVQMDRDPWTSAVETSVPVPKNVWKLVTFSGVAQTDLPAGIGMLSAQISSTKQVLDFGPAFVLNLGPGVQPSTLPRK